MITIQASKSHSSQKPKSEHMSPATTSAHRSDTPVHTTTISPITLSYSRLVIRQANLVLKLTGWVFCLKIFKCALPELKDLSTPPTIKSNYASRPWRIS